jgi:phosphatidylserine/phosphatidylglycerophosphate/cardiolipin synthase-like enzyme
VNLIVQPADGLDPILQEIARAERSIDLTVFRLDRAEVVKALEEAVTRGVAVRALIAHTNGSREKALRKLELRLLDAGVTVARSADDLQRYHAKLLVIDGTRMYLMGFNYTKLDLRSRSFGLLVEDDQVVKEATRLFEADLLKQPYDPPSESSSLVVSPENSRRKLSEFIQGAQRQLLVYDGRLSDRRMLKLLEERARAGLDVRVLGRCAKGAKLASEKLPKLRLHVRGIIRDGEQAFLGSQSLRRLELDGRRELGIITAHRQSVRRLQAVFEEDWALTETARASAKVDPKEAAASA